MHASYSRSLHVFVGVVMTLAALPATAGTTYCNIDVYTAYDKAVKRGWKFECKNATFVPEHARRAISCQGKTPPIVPPSSIIGRALFFSANGERPALKQGWSVHSYEVEGGQHHQVPANASASQTSRVVFTWEIGSPNVSFKRRLAKLKLKKSNGDCSKAYDEAF